MTKKFKVKFAWLLLVVSCIGWPVSQFTIARDEPPFVLALSWLAIILTALDFLGTAQMQEKQKDKDES